MSNGLLMESTCARPSAMVPSRTSKRREGPSKSPCCTHLCSGYFWAERIRSRSTCHRTWPGPSATRQTSRETGPINLVQSVLQVHCQKTPFPIVAVLPEPSPDRTDFRIQALLCRAEVSCHAGRWPPSFSVQSDNRDTGDPGHNGARNVAFGYDVVHGVEGSHHVVSVHLEDASFDVLWTDVERKTKKEAPP